MNLRDGIRTQIQGFPGIFEVASCWLPGLSLPKMSRSCVCIVNKNRLVQNPAGGFCFSLEELQIPALSVWKTRGLGVILGGVSKNNPPILGKLNQPGSLHRFTVRG